MLNIGRLPTRLLALLTRSFRMLARLHAFMPACRLRTRPPAYRGDGLARFAGAEAVA